MKRKAEPTAGTEASLLLVGEQEQEEDDDEGDVNDMEDIYEDKGKDVRQEEDFELPDDLELDGNDKKDQEEEGGMDDEEEEEEEEEGTSSGTASGPNRFCMKSL